ncbi:uncharacterized protein MELLADRAFT_90158 [Melampsora larici-populina 98AG31]|uniref:SGNH hydrolase-type esterase domain-containing protein n=1 Tax=Melampsora larici-populina (strain 98AG31 / pathotype 3-4-7) TaxID=747676 RepID=F4RVW7_MELLP|nr:uncharacterized protein MELLADRAFT_90158 [Melampsora larici-populina 98AG31]EGG03510.1 hypothetical protein MELLADRAFT_90158 [Melampsora larici-populina 98AG31]
MSNGQKTGSTPLPAVPNSEDPKYGGRASNGLIWIEQLGDELGALVRDYARGGAIVSSKLTPPAKEQSDMIEHVQVFLDQKNQIDAASSIAMICYGINDGVSASRRGATSLSSSAQELISQTELLIQAGIQNVVVLSPPKASGLFPEFNNIIWNGLKSLKAQTPSIQFAYVDFSALYSAINADPQSFGQDFLYARYESAESCLKSATSLDGACQNPDVYLYYIPNHPQKLTHGLMAQWADVVLSNCT